MAGGSSTSPGTPRRFRGDQLEAALLEIAPRRCATARPRGRSTARRDDRYKFLQMVDVRGQGRLRALLGRPASWSTCAAITSGWYQVPVLYVWHDLCGAGEVGDGNGNGVPEPRTRAVGGRASA